jgi:hypothetical protein
MQISTWRVDMFVRPSPEQATELLERIATTRCARAGIW